MAQNVRSNPAATGRGYSGQPGRDVVIGYEEQTVVVPSRLRRISWGAVIAGIVLALVVQIALHLLGLSIGVNTINPATEADPVGQGFGTAAAIWIAASILISLFAGGWVAGYLAGVPDRTDGALHGLLVWGVVMLLSLWLLTSSAISLVNGVSSALGSALSAAGQGVAAVARGTADVAPEVSNALQNAGPELEQALGLETGALDQINSDVRSFLGVGTTPGVAEGEGAIPSVATPTAGQTQQAEAVVQEITTAVQDLLQDGTIDEARRQEVVQLIAERTSVTQEEAQQTLTRWETSLRDARAQLDQTIEDVTQRLADTVAGLAGVLFLAMILGAFAAGAGGLVGSPDEDDMLEASAATTTTTTS